MIQLKNVDKYFNKRKSNEIHVINQTSIDFPEKGLVAITGPSGCGKTTLLNVIAGLDSFYRGEIIYEGESITKYKSSKIDKIRNAKIGFIFQNYNLIPDQTVYNNIKTSLNIAGLYDKEQIEERISYSLEQVGMYNYRNRSVLALSGGQQQRVGIARAIAKNPDVILADEPTGNLDSNNTFEVMSLIKNISRNKLVILVTHERNIVDYYADRIIELKDGSVVNDYQNLKNLSYDHQDDRYIYLRDLQKENIETKFIDYYYENENNKNFNLKIVETNNTIYIQGKSNKKITYIDDESEIHLLDDHKKELKVDEMKLLDFDSFEPINHQEKKSLFRWRDTLLNGLKKLFSKQKLTKKITIFVYFIISAIIAGQLASLGNLIKVDESRFITAPKSYIGVESDTFLTNSQLSQVLSIDGIELPYYQTLYLSFYKQTFYQTKMEVGAGAQPVKASWVNSNDIVHGTMPTNNNEVVISTQVAKMILQDYSVTQLGIKAEKDLIGFFVKDQNNHEFDLQVIGIIDTSESIVVLADESYPIFLTRDVYSSVGLFKDDIDLVSGRLPVENNEVIFLSGGGYVVGQETNIDIYKDGSTSKFTVVGIYDIKEGSILFAKNTLFTDETFEDAMIHRATNVNNYQSNKFNFHFYAKNKDKAIQDIKSTSLDVDAFDVYENSRTEYLSHRTEEISAKIVSVAAILAGVILFIYFVMKTSMISRVKEIGIYRSIGASKKDVYKIFLSEVLVYTTFASATGYLIASYVLTTIEKQIADYLSVFYLPFWLLMIGLAGIYLVNIVFGLLPIYNLMKKTPAEILAKYDI